MCGRLWIFMEESWANHRFFRGPATHKVLNRLFGSVRCREVSGRTGWRIAARSGRRAQWTSVSDCVVSLGVTVYGMVLMRSVGVLHCCPMDPLSGRRCRHEQATRPSLRTYHQGSGVRKDGGMNRIGGKPALDGLSLLHKQLQELVVVLTVASGPADVRMMLRQLAGTAIGLEQLLATEEPMILDCLRAAFAHAAGGRTDELRGDLLDASRHLFVLLKAREASGRVRKASEGFTFPGGESAFRR